MKVEEKSGPLARVNIKLAPGVNPDQVKKILSGTPGLHSIVQLFPDETDEEMLSLYILEINPDQLDDAMKQLHENPKLESAHETARRKLIW